MGTYKKGASKRHVIDERIDGASISVIHAHPYGFT
jgi:hypothetical protein